MPRNILLLQGPVGPFFRKFSRQLKDNGHRVVKVNLNGGDLYYYRSGKHINFKGEPSVWPQWIESIMVGRRIDRIYLFGDCRRYHRQAIVIARRLGIEVFVFEEGYVRPNYITLEKDGVNGFSTACEKKNLLTRLESRYDTEGENAKTSAAVRSVFLSAACSSMQYYMASSALRFMFPSYEHHRPLKTLSEGLIWIRSGFRKTMYRLTERRISQRLTGGEASFFLLALQVHNDMQVTQHSDFGSVEDFIERVVISFSKAASKHALVIKHHPYDRGYKNYAKLIKTLASRYGLEGRVHYVHDTDLPSLLQRALGTVIINSTVGISSLYHGTPAKAMGNAIYDLPGLTHQGALEDFWDNPGVVNKRLFGKFRRYLVETTQVNGSVYTDIESCDGKAGVCWSPHMFKLHIEATPTNVIELDKHRVAESPAEDDSVFAEVEAKKLAV